MKQLSITKQDIKFIKELQTSKSKRDSDALFVVEGANLIKDINRKFIKELYILSTKINEFKDIIFKFDLNYIKICNEKEFLQISDTKTPQGILAICYYPKLRNFKDDIILVLDGIKDPQNYGTIVRTAVALNISDIIAISSVSKTSPKVVRGTMGAIFRANILEINDYSSVATYLSGRKVLSLDMAGDNIYNLNSTLLKEKLAIVLGSESSGLSKYFREKSDKLISLPMLGDMESLNAAVAMSVSLFEIIHKRGGFTDVRT